MPHQTLAGVLSAIALTLACAGPSAPVPAAQPTSPSIPAPEQAPLATLAPLPLRVGYAAPEAGLAPVWVAQERGLFRQHGLDVDLVFLSSARTDQAVITG